MVFELISDLEMQTTFTPYNSVCETFPFCHYFCFIKKVTQRL
jgi:hypothetical protein